MDSPRLSLRARLTAKARGELPIEDLQNKLNAGQVAYDSYMAADELRQDLAANGIQPWNASPAETSQLLCAWCAWALQSLAQAFVDADQRADTSTPGFVAGITATQVELLTYEVPVWSARAERAVEDPGYDVGTEASLPVAFTRWVAVEPCPPAHLAAMRAATATMLQHLQTALADATTSGPATPEVQQLRGLVAEVRTRFAGMTISSSSRASRTDHQAEEATLRDGVQRCYVLGQLLARPRLLHHPTGPSGGRPQWTPGGPVPLRFGRPAHGHDGHHDDSGHH